MLQFQKSSQKKDDKAEQTTLGFEEDSALQVFTSNVKRRIKRLGQEVRYSGAYNNFWLWNIVFLHFTAAIVLGYLVYRYLPQMPDRLGVTIDNVRRYETIVSNEFLYFLVIFHVLCGVATLVFGLKSERRLNHLLIAAFFNFLVLAFYEFFALRDFIFYFL
jgi:hypothetical protein